MKKTTKKSAFIIACLIGAGLSTKVNAATLAIGNDKTSVNSTGEVTIELKDDEYRNLSEFQKVEFKLSISGTTYAEIGGVSPSTSGYDFQISGNTYSFDASTQANPNGTLSVTTLGKITYNTKQINSNFQIALGDVKFYKKDGTVADTGTKVVNGNIEFQAPKSNVAELSSLTVSQGTMSPATFSKDITEYKVQVRDTIQSVRINATANERGTVTGTGIKQNLQIGENSFDIVVTSEDGTNTNTYKVVIIRGEIIEPSAYLKKLEINNIGVALSPEFDSKNNKYTVTVGEEIDKLTFNYETEDPLATVTIDGNENFEIGENLVQIKVISSGEDPTEQTYEITIIKEVEDSEEESTITEINNDDKKKPSVWIIVSIVAGILAIIGGVVFILFKKKKTGKSKKDNNPPAKTKKHSLMEDDDEEDEEELEDTEEKTLLDEYTKDDTSTLESTITLNRTSRLAKRDESVTDILKGELFEDEKTRQFDSHAFREIVDNEDDGIDKTKEFNFRDFE